MSFLQALRYFLAEAGVSLVRSWRVSTLAVLTIGVSLFLAGGLFLVSSNLARTVVAWREEARLVVYLADGVTAAAGAEVAAELERASWVVAVATVSPEAAEVRFQRAFPSLAELVERPRGQGRLPASIEARLAPAERIPGREFAAWLAALRARPEIETIDDDRDWIAQVETALALVRALGLGLTAVLTGASVFTIASVVRFTALLYREEIAIMRLVGATEFFIRGPFYVEGVLQGLLGAGVAVAGLWLGYLALGVDAERSLVWSAVAGRFLTLPEIGLQLAFGAAAGLAGAVVSLGREGLPGAGAPS